MELEHDEHGDALEGPRDPSVEGGERETPTADEVLEDQGGLEEAVERPTKFPKPMSRSPSRPSSRNRLPRPGECDPSGALV
jgi:hypothetical protein